MAFSEANESSLGFEQTVRGARRTYTAAKSKTPKTRLSLRRLSKQLLPRSAAHDQHYDRGGCSKWHRYARKDGPDVLGNLPYVS